MKKPKFSAQTIHQICTELTAIVNKYEAGEYRHIEYMQQYDKTLERHGITKAELLELIKK